MAALQHGAAFTAAALGHRWFMPGKVTPVICSSSTSFPIKRTGRKNRLRQKILKTLEKPIIPKLPPVNPILPIDSPSQEIGNTQEIKESEKSETSEAVSEEFKKSEELSEIEGSVHTAVDGNVGIFPKNSILKYGLWLVGAFAFQTVCAVWFFGSADIDSKSEVLNGRNGKIGSKISAVSSNIYVDELEMERKIKEIRVMAREAREKERLESKRSGIDSEDSEGSDDGKYSKSGIEEEVDNRLVKLRKKLGNTRLKMPVALGVETGELDDRESNGALLFKKKYKFRGLSGDPVEKPKGFGSDDKNENGVENQIEVTDVDLNRIEAVNLVEDGNKKGMTEMNEPTGTKVERERGTSKKGKRKDAAKPKVVDGVAFEKNSRRRSKTDFWWLNLPYVLAIAMRRGEDGEGGEGLYTLRSISSAEDQMSYMVAFEDQADATKFCNLLKSFFKDLELEDFQADVVPLTIEELKEALKLFDEKVLVVKRGQLKLYAGQPLTDAEVALRAMIEQI